MHAVKISEIARRQSEYYFQSLSQFTVIAIGEEKLIIANHNEIVQAVHTKYALNNKLSV